MLKLKNINQIILIQQKKFIKFLATYVFSSIWINKFSESMHFRLIPRPSINFPVRKYKSSLALHEPFKKISFIAGFIILPRDYPFSMFKAILKTSFINKILLFFYSISMLFVFKPISFIAISIYMHKLTFPLCSISNPVSLIEITIWMN